MELYTIINDKTKWNNHLKGDGLFKAEKYSKEQAEEFLNSVNDYALKDCYSYSYEYDDYNDKSSGGGIYYHEINVDELLICEDKVVGVIFVTKHNESAMSNCYTYNFNALFFDAPNKEKGENWNGFCKLENCVVTPSKTFEEDSTVYLIKKTDVPTDKKYTPFQIENLLY